MNIKYILSLTDFKKNAADIVKKIKKERTPAILTVNGSASVVVMDAQEYQKMKEYAELGYVLKGIDEGIKSMEKNRGVPKDLVFHQLQQTIAEVLAEEDNK